MMFTLSTNISINKELHENDLVLVETVVFSSYNDEHFQINFQGNITSSRDSNCMMSNIVNFKQEYSLTNESEYLINGEQTNLESFIKKMVCSQLKIEQIVLNISDDYSEILPENIDRPIVLKIEGDIFNIKVSSSSTTQIITKG